MDINFKRDSYKNLVNDEDEKRAKARQDQWKTMLEMVNKTNPQTMLGYSLGNLLGGAWKRYNDGRRRAKGENLVDMTGNPIKQEAEYTNISPEMMSAPVDPNSTITLQPGLMGEGFGKTETTKQIETPEGKITEKTEGVTPFNPAPFNMSDYQIPLNKMAESFNLVPTQNGEYPISNDELFKYMFKF